MYGDWWKEKEHSLHYFQVIVMNIKENDVVTNSIQLLHHSMIQKWYFRVIIGLHRILTYYKTLMNVTDRNNIVDKIAAGCNFE